MQNRYLTLTGPTRAVVVVDPVYLEVDLRVKGRTESEDRALSYLGVNCRETGCSESYMFKCVETSKLSTVELTLGDMAESVEATISVKVVDEEWPEGFGGLISARTASISDMEIKLLAFDKLPVAADGTIQLSRRVVSVEARGMLRVTVMPNCLDDRTVEGVSIAFKAREASRSTQMLEVCSCKLEVTIACEAVISGVMCDGSGTFILSIEKEPKGPEDIVGESYAIEDHNEHDDEEERVQQEMRKAKEHFEKKQAEVQLLQKKKKEAELLQRRRKHSSCRKKKEAEVLQI
ncbi:hypothetical protein D1007_49568 [Hordeum vulgare]|nr:hypothetical protein D1007_49568 [Hordeum vulgare]